MLNQLPLNLFTNIGKRRNVFVDGWRRHSGDLFVDELKTAIPWQQKSMLASGTGGAKTTISSTTNNFALHCYIPFYWRQISQLKTVKHIIIAMPTQWNCCWIFSTYRLPGGVAGLVEDGELVGSML